MSEKHSGSVEDSGSWRLREHHLMQKAAPHLYTLVAAVVLAIGTPVMIPSIHRPDPATGKDMERIEDRVNAIDEKVTLFVVRGPDDVRENQKQIIELLGTMNELAAESLRMQQQSLLMQQKMQQAQLEHFGVTTETVRKSRVR